MKLLCQMLKFSTFFLSWKICMHCSLTWVNNNQRYWSWETEIHRFLMPIVFWTVLLHLLSSWTDLSLMKRLLLFVNWCCVMFFFFISCPVNCPVGVQNNIWTSDEDVYSLVCHFSAFYAAFGCWFCGLTERTRFNNTDHVWRPNGTLCVAPTTKQPANPLSIEP